MSVFPPGHKCAVSWYWLSEGQQKQSPTDTLVHTQILPGASILEGLRKSMSLSPDASMAHDGISGAQNATFWLWRPFQTSGVNHSTPPVLGLLPPETRYGQGVGTAAMSPGPNLQEEKGHMGTRGARESLAGTGSHRRGFLQPMS